MSRLDPPRSEDQNAAGKNNLRNHRKTDHHHIDYDVYHPGNPKVVIFLYSADLSSKNVFVKAKTYFYDLLCRKCVDFPFGGPFDL